MAEEYKYIYNLSGITSLKSFLGEQNSLFKIYSGDEKTFLAYIGNDEKSNLDRIWENYTEKEQLQYVVNYNEGLLDYIKPNTILRAPKDKTNIEILSITGKNQFLEQQSLRGFWSEQLLIMQNDPKFVPKDVVTVSDSVSEQTPNCRVFIWIRALGKIMDVSPFIEDLSTTVDDTGSWNMSLAPIKDLSSVVSSGAEVFSETNINESNSAEKIITPYFHKYIAANDIVFIRHEVLNLDKDIKTSIADGYIVEKNALPGQNFDMIGLVDTNSVSYGYTKIDITVELRGRDLSKLLIEDSSLFFTNRFTQDSKRLFVNLQEDDRWMKRIFASAEYSNLFVSSYRSIRDSIGFIINQLANIGIVDDDLFSAYGDKKSQSYTIDPTMVKYLTPTDVNGIWQIVRFLIDPNVEDRRIADGALKQPDGTLINQFAKMCQEPFVEFFGDTYGDTYNFIVRQPPFNQEALIGWMEDNTMIEITGKDVLRGPSLSFSEEVYTWFEVQPQQSYNALAFIPVVSLPQYTNIWGNKGKRIESNYITRLAIGGEHEKTDGNIFQRAIIEDLKYLIDIYACLPFTRQGTITINRDRRIKKGTFIRFKPTSEIFYVDSVTHDYNATIGRIDSSTTLRVSRGMVEKYIKGSSSNSDTSNDANLSMPPKSVASGGYFEISVVANKPKKMSYFDIVDTDLIRSQLIQQLESAGTESQDSTKNTATKFGVNEDVLNFFLQRKQFD